MAEKNIFVSSTYYGDNSKIENVLAQCTQNGIGNIELGSNHVFETNPVEVVLKFNCQFIVHNYFPVPQQTLVINIASMNADIYDRSIQHIFKSIDFCKKIYAKLYTFHPGFLSDPEGANIDTSNYDFQFASKDIESANYSESFDRMVNAISKISDYAEKQGVKIAIETEGSFEKSEHLLMQRPDEYRRFMDIFSQKQVGINLNIGHLYLASQVFKFDILEFVALISNYIVAMELSHNNGIKDEHKPLIEGPWYWDVITNKNFVDVIKILEFRDAGIEKVINSMSMFNAGT